MRTLNSQSGRVIYLLIAWISLICISKGQQWYQKGNPHFICEEDFQKLVLDQATRNRGVTFVKYFTPWCRYCKFLKDIFDRIKTEGQYKITFLEVNCDGPNYHFCGKMGVHSFPKVTIFQNGSQKQGLDGFYPHQVIKELVVKYNKTSETITESPSNQQIRSAVQINFVEPEIVPLTQIQQQPQNKPTEIAQTSLNKQSSQPEIKQQVKAAQLSQAQQPKIQQKNLALSQQVKTQQFYKQNQKANQQVNENSQHINKNHGNAQKIVQAEQNVAIVGQNPKITQNQKEIMQQVSRQKHDVIDLNKIDNAQNNNRQYGKYAIYAICLLVGGYYFLHITKGDPQNNNNSQSDGNKTQQNGLSKSTKNTSVTKQLSFQDSEFSEQQLFEHPQHDWHQNNSDQEIQINDQDL